MDCSQYWLVVDELQFGVRKVPELRHVIDELFTHSILDLL